MREKGEDNLSAVSRRVNVKIGNNKVMGVVRENYLRSDLCCRSEICFEGCAPMETDGVRPILLPADVTHYLLPLEDVVRQHFDVLASPELRGLILLQSVVNPVQLASQRHYRKICALVRDPAKASVFFANEFCKETSAPRKCGESAGEHKSALAFAAANWYYDHLGGQRPVVVVTEDESVLKAYETKRIEIFALRLGDYLDKFWPTLKNLRELYDELSAARKEDNRKDYDDFAEYLKPGVLEAGLRKGKFIRGRLNVSKHHPSKEAFVSVISSGKKLNEDESTDVLVPGLGYRNRAVHGDTVVIQLLPKSEWRSRLNRLSDKRRDGDQDEDGEKQEEKWERRSDLCSTGRVVGVLHRNWREFVATVPKQEAESLERRSGKRILAVPYDKRVPKVRILTAQAKRLASERIVVAIDSWPVTSQYPNGHFVRSLGALGQLETEIDAILTENSIAVKPFSQGMLAEMPADDWKPDEEEIARRRDLRRTHLVASIDPPGCEDVDDALSVKKLSNGNIELGVHIADVTFFVKSDSLTDTEARGRATTVYLADRRYDMLPSVLSANICSLLGNVDRYAVSVLWELNPSENYRVISTWYGRTVIRSDYKLSYEVAQDIINGVKSEEEMKEAIPELARFAGQGLTKRFKLLRETLLTLTKVAQSVQDDRERHGALSLESSEVRFEFDASAASDPTKIKPKEHLKVHETVAECMIMANHWVAKKIAKKYPHFSLLRRHAPPRKENFDKLRKCAASKGWKVDTWSNRVLAESLNACVDPQDPNVNFLLRSLATYAMVQAEYFSTGSVRADMWEHYGLALSQYTHFTSPIRRYADIIVHRILLAAIEKPDWFSSGESADDVMLMKSSRLQELCEHINERNRAAQNAQRDSQTLFQTLFFRGKAPDDPRCIVDAVIFDIRTNGLLVYVPR